MRQALAHRHAVGLLVAGSVLMAPFWVPGTWSPPDGIVLVASLVLCVACVLGLASVNLTPSRDPDPHVWLARAGLWSLLLPQYAVMAWRFRPVPWSLAEGWGIVFVGLGGLCWVGLGLLALGCLALTLLDRANWRLLLAVCALSALHTLSFARLVSVY